MITSSRVRAAKASAPAVSPDLELAATHCEALTRSAAGNFYWGIRLLPPAKRSAMCAVYALARRIDDVGDGDLPIDEKLRQLDAIAADVAALPGRPVSGDLVLAGVAAAAERFPLPLAAFAELVEGVRMDVSGARYDHWEDLERYCRLVAGTVGRLCLGVFGSADPDRGPALADELGVAMQLINILRDVREDGANGRLYLPDDDLARFGLAGGLNGGGPGFPELIAYEAHRAREWLGRGMELVPLLDRRSAACVLTMTGIYARLLDRLEAEPQAVLRGRLSLSAPEKAMVAMRSLTGAVK